jgi:hypothetical protein
MKLVIVQKPKINLESLTKEMIIEDIKGFLSEEEWWSEPKRYKADTRAIKINLGYVKGASKMRHVKKGGSFTKNMPKRRPKQKGSAPPLVESNGEQQQLIDFFRSLTIHHGKKFTLIALRDISKAKIKKDTKFEVQYNKTKDVWTISPGLRGLSELDEKTLLTAIYYAKLSISDFQIEEEVEVTEKQKEKIVTRLVKTYTPGIAKDEGFFEQLLTSVADSPIVKTIKDIAGWFWDFIMHFVKGMGLDYLFGYADESPAGPASALPAGVVVSDGVGQTRTGRVDGKRAVFLPNQTRVGGTAAWRNNNPGNIRLTRYWKNWGAIGYSKTTKGGFAIFPSQAAGLAALKKYIIKYGFESNKYTIKTFMGMYCPGCAKYPRWIAQELGTSVHAKMSTLRGNQRAFELFVKMIRKIEGYRPGKIHVAHDYKKA